MLAVYVKKLGFTSCFRYAICMKLKLNPTTLPYLSAVLLGLAFTHSVLSWLVFIGLVPMCYYILGKDFRQKHFWLAGWLFMLIIIHWMLQTTPSNWTALEGGFATFNKAWIWASSALVFSVGFALVGLIISRLKLKQPIDLLWLVLVWPVGEVVRSMIYSLYSAGPGWSFGPHWNFGNLAFAGSDTPLAFGGRLLGLYGLSALVVLANVAIFWAIQKQWRLASIGMALVLILPTVGFSLSKATGQSKTLAAWHLNSEDQIDPAKYDAAPADILALPEYAMPEPNQINPDQSGRMLKAGGAVVSTDVDQAEPPHNNLIFYSASAGPYSIQAKTFLVPTGEFLPYLVQGLFKLLNRQYIIDEFNQNHLIARGTKAIQVVTTPGGIKVGALPCSGILAVSEYQRLAGDGADVLVNPASLILLSKAPSYQAQAHQINRFVAIASARPLVQSARAATSYMLDGNGIEIARTSGDSKVIAVDAQIGGPTTLYNSFGNLLWWGFSLVAAVIWLYYRNRS